MCLAPCRSFTDIAFIDYQDNSTDWLSNGIVSAKAYEARLGRPPQSLNDFAMSCERLLMAQKLPMPLSTCEAKRQQFGQSMRVIR
jgi:hypothetical protein